MPFLTLRRTDQLPDFPWSHRRSASQFLNVDDPWTPGFLDVMRWKLRFGPAEISNHRASVPIAPPSITPNLTQIEYPNREQIQAIWIGHSTFLLQVAGLNILTDPIFSEYCSPWPMARLRRSVPPGLSIQDLPRIDLILLSHAHYDHLDRASLQQLGANVPIACPLGLAPLLRRWGFTNVIEFGWGDRGELGDAVISCLPVQHGAARTPFDRDTTLWCGWMLEIHGHRIFFAGDTGYASYFPELFASFAPVDLALLPIGAYTPSWFMQPLHLNPAEAVQVHRDLRARVSIAMHWGTFRLADEPLDAPPGQLRAALVRASIPNTEFRIADIGETITLPAIGAPSYSSLRGPAPCQTKLRQNHS